MTDFILRRTKILATLGPATDDENVLKEILDASVNIVRINFSHGNEKEHIRRINAVRRYAKNNNKIVGILMDLQGPKIRISSFKNDFVYLKEGDKFILDADLGKKSGGKKQVAIRPKSLPKDIKKDNILLLDDGKIIMKVVAVIANKIYCKVTQGGKLSNKKGINLKGGGLSTNALTKKDLKDIKIAAQVNADYVALSFPVNANDVIRAKELLKQENSNAGIIAKIERAESLKQGIIEHIIEESEGIMIARGDLGVEIGDPLLPAQQKRLIKLARTFNKPVITATQMLDSMINSPVPTRAEVFDVANAVLDGTDAVMLSAETATGRYPINVVDTVKAVCVEAEKNPLVRVSEHRLHEKFKLIDETIALSAMYAGNHLNVKAIVALTQTGRTALWMSRISSKIPIYAMSDKDKTLQKATLYRGVYPCKIVLKKDWSEINHTVVRELQKRKAVKDGDIVIITKGMYKNQSGGTNLLKIVKVGGDY